MTTTDYFNREARAFLGSYSELGLEELTKWHLPEKDTPKWRLVGRMIDQGGWLRDQENNPLIDLDIPQKLVIDLAKSFLLWCGDPSQPRWVKLFEDRDLVRQCEDYFQRHD